MNTLPTLPDALFHGSAVEFCHIDVSKGRGRKDFGKGFYMSLSVQQYVGRQSVADRLVAKFESVDWREYA